jgi:hypothetical protein
MAKPFAPAVTARTCATLRVLHRLSCRARIGDDVQRPDLCRLEGDSRRVEIESTLQQWLRHS